MRFICAGCLAIGLAVICRGGFALADEPVAKPNVSRPNFVVILVDDLGWADLGCMGSQFHETPHIDRLAARGVKFTQAYSACTVCSPTRAALLTGKYPARLHLTDWIAGHPYPAARLSPPEWTQHLPLAETTLAEALRGHGYATASIGKWHLGGEEFAPEKHGFDLNVGGYFRGQPPSFFAPYKIPTLPEGPAGEFLTDRESAEAVKFIAANRDRPFLLYLPHYAVHQPIAGKADVIEKYRRKVRLDAAQQNPVYAALLESVDDSVGRIVAKLDELRLTDRTWIVFASDNGGLVLGKQPVTSNAPLRAGKGSVYEGGVRTPLIIAGPGVKSPGRPDATVTMTCDLFPTVLDLASVATSGMGIDGHSLAPVIRGEGSLKRNAVFWHYPHYHPGGATPYGAVRAGDWKLIEFDEDQYVELYDLAKDVAEKVNLANQLPAQATELRKLLADWRREVGAQMPRPNPRFDPARADVPTHVVRPQASGEIVLHARDVEIHGSTVRYEPQPHKNTIGYWTQVGDGVSWDFLVAMPGEYRMNILQGCGPGSGGSDVDFQVNGQTVSIVVQETKGFQDFLAREIGIVKFDAAGRYRLTVQPRKKPGVAVMDLRQVTLQPHKPK